MKNELYNFITNNIAGEHPDIKELPSVVTYAREIGLFTAYYIPYSLKTDKEVYEHIIAQKTIRPPFFRNKESKVTRQATNAEEFILQNKQHIEFLANLKSDSNQTFMISNNVLIETKPLELNDLFTKNGVIAKNHLKRTVTYSGHGVAVPNIHLKHPLGLEPVIGIPKRMFKKLKLNDYEPIMFLRNPVIKEDGIHFAYPVEIEFTEHAIAVHPYFCSGMNLDFDGDNVNIYKIMKPENIKEVIALMEKRYPKPLPLPENKDFILMKNRFKSLSLQDYVNNTPVMQEFLSLKPSKKCDKTLIDAAKDLCITRTEVEFSKHLEKSLAYIGLFQSKADVGKTGGLYKKLIYAFPGNIKEIMLLIEPLTQATLDQKHTVSGFSVDYMVNAYNNIDDLSNLNYILEHTPKEHHGIVKAIHKAVVIKPLNLRHKDNMNLLVYLGTKFSAGLPKSFNNNNVDNIFNYLISLNNPTNNVNLIEKPVLEELSKEKAFELADDYAYNMENKPEMIPQKYLDLKDGNIYEHKYNKTLVDKTNAMSVYLTSQMVSVPAKEGNSMIMPPKRFCPYQRTEKDPENMEPVTFVPKIKGLETSAAPLNIPYKNNTEHARLVYACNNIKQAMDLLNPEYPLCKTKYHKTLKIGVNLKATFMALPYTYEDAVVISVTASRKLGTVKGDVAHVGDKITGRHGNKAVIACISPDDKMPYGAEIIFSPMSITSRKNFGFLAEIQSNIMHNNESHIEEPIEELLKQPDPKVDGYLTGTVYVLRNSHTAESCFKNYSRPYKENDFNEFNQPKSGENISLNHVYALEVLGLRNLITEFYTFRSNKDLILKEDMESIVEPESLSYIRGLYNNLV